MKYTVIIGKPVTKEIRKFPKPIILAVFRKIKSLEIDPRPAGCKRLSGLNEPIWRVRVGDYRILYTINDVIKVVDIRKAGHRKDVYE